MVRDGIDVSQHQGVIDWELVKRHIDFAIIRCGYGQDIPVFRGLHHVFLEVIL